MLDFPGTYVDADFADLDGDGQLGLVGLSEPEGIARHSDEPVSQDGYRPFWCRRLPGPGIAFGLSRSLADLAARVSRCCWCSCLSCPVAGGGSGLPVAPGRCIIWSWPPCPAAGQGERRSR